MSTTKSKHRLAVLVSGSGTLLDAIINDGIPVALVMADRPCLGLEKASKAGIETVLIERTEFGSQFDRDCYTKQVVDALQDHGITFVCMAGWNTILAQAMFDAFGGHITNNHPALLPKFKGHYAVRDALASGEKVTGCTVHIATLELDDGPILGQIEVPIKPGDNEDTLHERIKRAEWQLLPRVLREQLDLPAKTV